MCDILQDPLRSRVRLVVAIHEADGPAMNDLRNLMACEFFRFCLEMAHEHLNHFGELDATPPDGGRFVYEGRAKNRFERSHQPPIVLAYIGVHGLAPVKHAAVMLEIEEDGARDERGSAFHRRQRRGAVAPDAERRVGSAEVQSASRHDKPLWVRNGALIYYAKTRLASLFLRL